MYEHPRFLLRAEERLRRMCFGGREKLGLGTKKEKRKKASELLT